MTMSSAYMLNKLGRLLLQKKNYDDAYEIFHQAIIADPSGAISFAFLGSLYWHQDQRTEALGCYQRALELCAHNSEILNIIGDFLRAVGRTEENKALHEIFSYSIKNQTGVNKKRKLLAVYDLSVQPYSVGDLIAFQAGALVKCAQLKFESMDFCFICDPDRIPLDPVFSRMMGNNNRLYNLFTLLPVLQLNPAIESISVFNSYREWHQLAITGTYDVWPTVEQIETNTYTYYEIIKLLDSHYRQFHYLPKLELPGALMDWVAGFMHNNVGSALPVTVNLRNNPNFHPERNSDISTWITFFNYCHTRYPVTFIVVCSRSEVAPELRTCPNVIIAKDHHTSLEHDMALIMFSAFHMGASSGPSTIPVFSDKPYSIMNCKNLVGILHLYDGSIVRESEQIAKFSFAQALQRLILEPERIEILINEFETIWNSREWSTWSAHQFHESGSTDTQCALSWLK